MKHTDIKRQLIALAGITEEQYAVLMWELGNEYALHLLQNEHVADKLTATGTFWDWWGNQWQIADAAFMKLLECYTNIPTGKTFMALWLAEHKPERVRSYPGKYVFTKVKIS